MTTARKRQWSVTTAVVIAILVWCVFVVPAITTTAALDFLLGVPIGLLAGPVLVSTWHDEWFGRWS